jgi:CBS domain-containing protein
MMHTNDRNFKQGDKLLKMPGKLDRGPVEFKSHIVSREGDIMAIATRDVVSVPPTSTIMGAVEKMTGCGFRRLPIVDPGSGKLRGIITSGDIINFMGGGDKFNLVQVRHGGNLLAAINEPVRTLMTQQLTTLPDSASIADAVEIIVTRKVGGMPITDSNGVLVGMVTERDVMKVLATEKVDLSVNDIMTTGLRVTDPDCPIGKVTRDMTTHRFRRLPVVSGDVLYGIITTSDIMKYLGTKKVFDQMLTGDVSEVMGLPVRNLVSSNLFTTSPDKGINEAAREMLDRNVGGLPVIEKARLVGLVTEFDMVRALART